MGTMEDREISGCLSACGLGAEQRERYLALARGGQTKEQMRLLWQRRKALMDDLHQMCIRDSVGDGGADDKRLFHS